MLALVVWLWESWWLNSATTQAQIQGSELAYPNICPIYELLKPVKEPILHIQSYRKFRTQGNNRISERSPSEVPVLIA